MKPGDTYPSRIIVTNPTRRPVVGATVTVTAPDGSTFPAAERPGHPPGRGRTTSPGRSGRDRPAGRPDPRAGVQAPPTPPRRTHRSSGATCRPPRSCSPPAQPDQTVDQPRPEGDPAERAPTTPRGTATGRSRSCRSSTPTAPTRPSHSGELARVGDQRPGQRRLDVQPLPGDVARAALPRTAPSRRPASRPKDFDLRTRLRLHQDSSPARPATCHRRHLRRPARRRRRARRSTPSGSPTASTTCPATTELLRLGRQRLGGRRLADRRRRAAEHRLAAAVPTGKLVVRRRRDRRPGDRLLRLRHRQGRRRRLLHGRLRRLRRQRRARQLAAWRRLRLRRRCPTTTSGRTARRSSATTPTRSPACPASPPTTSSRTSRAGRSGTPTPTYTGHDHHRQGRRASRCSSGSAPTTSTPRPRSTRRR